MPNLAVSLSIVCEDYPKGRAACLSRTMSPPSLGRVFPGTPFNQSWVLPDFSGEYSIMLLFFSSPEPKGGQLGKFTIPLDTNCYIRLDVAKNER
jgi:hypothetical protein